MKKLIAMLLALALMLSLAACGAEENPNADLVITRAPEEATQAPEENDSQDQAPEETQAVGITGPYTFVAEGVKLVPGEAFDASKLSEAQSTFESPSCAFQGVDKMYTYASYEITSYDEGKGEFILSVLLKDPTVATPEGLAISNTVEQMESIYGTGYECSGENYVYTNGETQLSIIAQSGSIISIEYRLVTN